MVPYPLRMCRACGHVVPKEERGRECAACGQRFFGIPAARCLCRTIVDIGDGQCLQCGRVWNRFDMTQMARCLTEALIHLCIPCEAVIERDGWVAEVTVVSGGCDYAIVEEPSPDDDRHLQVSRLRWAGPDDPVTETLLETADALEAVSALVGALARDWSRTFVISLIQEKTTHDLPDSNPARDE
jgi:hypothetical protein